MNERNSQLHHDNQGSRARPSLAATGSRDGGGSADHDQPFAGYKAYRFSTRQMLHLLRLRSEVLDGRLGVGRFVLDLGGDRR